MEHYEDQVDENQPIIYAPETQFSREDLQEFYCLVTGWGRE
jgi:hypothetical protein